MDSIAESLRNFIHVLDHGLQEMNNRRQPRSRGTTQSPPKTPDHVSITIEDDLVPDLPIGTWSGWSPPTSSSICAVGYTTSVRQRHLSYSDICPTATSVLQRHLSDSCYQKTTSVQNFDLSDRCRHADCSVDTTSSFYKSSVRFIRALEVCGEPRGLLRSYHW